MCDETLKSCPFCGGEAEIRTQAFGGVVFFAWCDNCETRGDYYCTEAEAIAAWNKRHVGTCHAESDLSEWVCSECQCWIPLGLTPDNIKHASEWRYCPHCGRRVKAVGEDDR